jgi:aminoglycoside phosphotransferase (APT) family kinase protein
MTSRETVPGVDLAQLAPYLPTVLNDYDPRQELLVRLLPGGRSNLTCLLYQGGVPRWVLRRPPLGHVMPSAHDMAREFAALSMLAPAGFPAPRPRALCQDMSVLGVTFLIYDYVPGLIISSAATARQLGRAEASQVCGSLISTLGQLHTVEPPPLPPGRSASARQYLDRQVDRWTRQWQHTRTRARPAFDQLADWLRTEIASLPTDYPVTIVHGDYRLDNLVLDPASRLIAAVLDWEMSTLGDPLLDLALLLVYWEEPGDGRRTQLNVARDLTTASDGFWSRDRLLREYLSVTGRPAVHLQACLGLACLKLAVIMESIHVRHLAGQALDDLSAGHEEAAPALLDMGLAAARHGVPGLAM